MMKADPSSPTFAARMLGSRIAQDSPKAISKTKRRLNDEAQRRPQASSVSSLSHLLGSLVLADALADFDRAAESADSDFL